MSEPTKRELILQRLSEKSVMKFDVYDNLCFIFHEMKKVAREIAEELRKDVSGLKKDVPIEYTEIGDFEFRLKFASDFLVVTMHTNVFEFSRDHEIMKTSYVKEDIMRSYCGVIHMYNFLADSYKYNRLNDIGYLIGRIFVNKDLHYFIEGKRQIGFLYNNFVNEVISKNTIKEIMEAAILYCIDFDLLTPPYDTIKEVSVGEMMQLSSNISLKTGKRLGFKFQADEAEIH